MYGYVRPPAGILSEEELERFRRMYCGLCHTLGQRYGTAARFILNYDFTYLAILLSGGDEGPSTAARCMVSPLKKRDYLCTTDALALAADESVILAYWQLRDGVADHDWLHGMKYRSLSAILEPAYRKASAARPAFAESTRRQLAHLAELEAQPCACWIRLPMPSLRCWALRPRRWTTLSAGGYWSRSSTIWDGGSISSTPRTI